MKTFLSLCALHMTLLLLIFAGCAKSPTVTEITTDESYEGLRYENVLVIGATGKITFRNLLEGRMVKLLQDQGLNPLPSYSILPYSNNLTRETVLNAVAQSGTEGILFISLIDTDKMAELDSLDTANPYQYYEGLQNMMTGAAETGAGDDQNLFLTTSLYDAKSERQIWSLTTGPEFKYNIKSLDKAITLAINKLKASGLLKLE